MLMLAIIIIANIIAEPVCAQDDAPLTGLPLLGYSVQLPSPADCISEELVLKLQYKNHVYFFRAESEYTFER
jgi:hypothetical protein